MAGARGAGRVRQHRRRRHRRLSPHARALGPWVPTPSLSHRAAAFLHEFDRSSPDLVEFTVASASRVNAKLDHAGPLDIHAPADRSCRRSTGTRARRRLARSSTSPGCDSRGSISKRRSTPPSAPGARRRSCSSIGSVLCADPDAGAPACSTTFSSTRGGHSMLERRFLEARTSRPGMHAAADPGGPSARWAARSPASTSCSTMHGVVVEVSGRKGHSSPIRAQPAMPSAATNSKTPVERVYEYTWAAGHPAGRVGHRDPACPPRGRPTARSSRLSHRLWSTTDHNGDSRGEDRRAQSLSVWASQARGIDTTITNVAITLTRGTLLGRLMLARIHCGNVS